MAIDPPAQYADDRNLRARQRLWEHQQPPFELFSWVLDLAEVAPGQRVLEVGCGNGHYLRELAARGIDSVGCDLSPGMLAAAPAGPLLNADVTALPVRDGAFDVVLAPHMLYHVPDRVAAARELRRVLRAGGVCVAVTNGAGHLRSVRELVEAAASRGGTAWEMRNPSTRVFSLENGEEQLRVAFDSVTLVRPRGVAPARVTDAGVIAGYVASVADHYQDEVARPWDEVVGEVRDAVQAVIDAEGAFVTAGDSGAFVCR